MNLTLKQRIANTQTSVALQEQIVLNTRDSYHRETEEGRLRAYKGILADLEQQLA